MEFLLLASAHFLALLSPGPDFFIVVQTALKKPLRHAIFVCLGITCANAIYLVIAVLGLEVIKSFQGLLLFLKYTGGAYLVFLGYRLIKAPKIVLEVEQKKNEYVGELSVLTDFIKGFLSGFLNPKNVIFYLSLFTVMVSVQTTLFTKSWYALWMCSMVLLWDILLSLLVGQKRIKQHLSKWIYVIEKISGVVLATFGILLVW
ncbi:MAG: threonine/homoserine/homoserine lactone efflux protein [Alteromonadaceae bacterium]|jgi:threonine/homoserine/homoserine lactone efflux protein